MGAFRPSRFALTVFERWLVAAIVVFAALEITVQVAR